ncbi:unnamed protein product [Albugo candida]|uniref:Uncharacterized protein n=1 Tax=Albugo candida TaxID=65357 RepID=A0A024FXM6_9STRA|nr:unnamed protein product [Albugo candida]|eukprot:CCI11781.1 unnamed protein product [Albugo candida]
MSAPNWTLYASEDFFFQKKISHAELYVEVHARLCDCFLRLRMHILLNEKPLLDVIVTHDLMELVVSAIIAFVRKRSNEKSLTFLPNEINAHIHPSLSLTISQAA